MRPTAIAVCLALSALATGPAPSGAEGATGDEAAALLQASGIKGGLVVHLGCGDGKLTAALCASQRYVVHGLDTDPKAVAAARRHFVAQGICGRVSADAFDGRHLPYVDNLVNLLVADDLGGVPMAEVMRVLAPRGVAMIGGRKTVKPWPDDIDEWTHYLHGPDNNAVADDRVAGPPRHMQWLAGPRWTRHHHSDKGTNPSIRAVVSAGGRLFYMVDEAGTSDMRVPGRWFLAARDAFSGVLLWKKPLEVKRFERRLERLWRTVIADGDHVYAPLGVDEPLSALDAATGDVVRPYPGTEGFSEAVKDGNTLFIVTREGNLLAVRSDSGAALWRWEPRDHGAIVRLTLAASGGRVFVRTERWAVCLSADGGRVVWSTPLEGPKKKARLRYPHEKLIVKDGVVLCSYDGNDPKSLDRDKYEYLGSHPRVREYGGKLAALSARDGRVLWRAPYMPGLESTPGELYVVGGTVWPGPDFAQPRDLHTGAVKTARHVIERLWTDGHHYRCYPGKATCRYIITAKRGIEMIDLAGENHSRNNWVRGTCRVGVIPANGLLYAPPHSCGCYIEAKLAGFWALAPATQRTGRVPGGEDSATEAPRLEKGPAFSEIASGRPQAIDSSDWPTYRHDAARSGSTATPVPRDLKPAWRAKLGGRLTAVTVAGGKVFVAQADAHTVHALDARTGQPVWRFTAGGRVDSPPTVHGGLALFGSSDGWVYCLRASDGALAWRLRAAPSNARAVAFEQVESLWPVRGSVLVHGGIAYVAAGRSSYLDGGIALYGLDPRTGRVRCSRRIASDHTGAADPPPEAKRSRMAARLGQNATDYKTFLAPDRSDAFSMQGALTDVMSAEGGSVFMRHLRFDTSLARQEKGLPHLFSTSSFLDGAEHHRTYLVLGTGDFSRTPVAFPWIIAKRIAVPYGLMLVFDAKTAWGVHRVGKWERTDHYEVFATPRPDPSQKESLLPDFARRSSNRREAGPSWSVRLPLRPRAMLRAGGALFIGCEQGQGGALRVVSCNDGATLGAAPLDAPPTWDGMAAADGRLYVALRNGSVVCIGNN